LQGCSSRGVGILNSDQEKDTVRILTEKIADLRRLIARQESDLVQVLLTLDENAHTKLKKGVDYDDTLALAMKDAFQTAKKELRVAIPYLTMGGVRDFAEMIDSAVVGPARVDLLFRFPENDRSLQVQKMVHERMRIEIGTGKVRIRYLGEREKSGLHAKVIIKDDDVAIVSSANWTGYSLSTNAEAGILTHSNRAVIMLQSWFDYLYENSRGWGIVRAD